MAKKEGNWFVRHKILTGIIAFVVLVGIVGAVSDGGTPSTPAQDSSGAKDSTIKPEQKENETPKTWTEIARLEGNADKSSPTVKLSGGQVRVKYTFDGDMIIGLVYVLKEGTDLQTDGGIPDVTVSKAGSDETILRKSAGDYYVHVAAANTNYIVTLEELK